MRDSEKSMNAEEPLEAHLQALERAYDFLAAMVATGAARYLDRSAIAPLEQVIEDVNREIGQWKDENDE